MSANNAVQKLPEPEVQEVTWAELNRELKHKYTKYDNWPLMIEIVVPPVLTEKADD
jgi:hypothetical protein